MLYGESMAVQAQLDEPRWPEVDDYVATVRKGDGSRYMSDHEERMSDVVWWEKPRPVRPKRLISLEDFGEWRFSKLDELR